MKRKLVVKVGGMSCVMCVRTVKRYISSIDGVYDVEVNLSTDRAYITYDPEKVSIGSIKDAIGRAGYKYLGEEFEDRDECSLPEVSIGVFLGVSLFILSRIWVLKKVNPILIFLLSTPLFLYVARRILRRGFVSILKGNLNMDVMYGMGMLTAYISSVLGTFKILSEDFIFFETPIVLASFLNIGRYTEGRARRRTSESIRRLMELKPER